MARLYPDVNKTRVIFASNAEEKLYKCCMQTLSDDWHVYNSCVLSTMERNRGMQDNEIDFVIYHPKLGAIAIEVKGGRIEFESSSGDFFSVNRHDQRFKIKNPFKQVLVWKSRFIRFLRSKDIRVPISHAVCFPSVSEKDIPQSASVETRLIIGLRGLENIEGTLKRIMKESRPESHLNFTDVGAELNRALRGDDFRTKLRLRAYLDNHELRLKDIEAITETLITPIASSKQLAVEGEAGTGKTMLAVMLARHFRNLGKTVLLLSSNPLMNSVLKDDCGSEVDVTTYADLGSRHGVDLMRKPASFKGEAEDWIQFEGPEKLTQAIAESKTRYDVVLGDEAQDVQPFWWDAITKLLASPEDSHYYLFFDSSQGVFGSGSSESSFVAEEVLPIPAPYFPLVHNYRTTREIAGFARDFRTGRAVLQSHCGRFGYRPEVVKYKDAQDFRQKIKSLFRGLFEDEGIKPEEVTILSARAPFKLGSTLQGNDKIANFSLLDLGQGGQKKGMPSARQIKGKIKVSTIPGFKGLETPVGVIVNLSEYNLSFGNPIMSSLFYVACTRAKHMLYIFLQCDDPKVAEVEAALNRLVQTGSMVLEGSRADHEFVGEVTHYNPDRVGWLKVSDPAFQRKSIMFFPYDLRKGEICNVQKGTRIRFRPKIEGHTPIACDLRLEPT